jgi:hypothetical protein
MYYILESFSFEIKNKTNKSTIPASVLYCMRILASITKHKKQGLKIHFSRPSSLMNITAKILNKIMAN